MPCYRASDATIDEDGGGGDGGDEKIKTLRKCVGVVAEKIENA